MNEQELLNIFEETGALQHGHFILSSGKRSGTYCQCSKLFVDPKTSSIIGSALAKKVESKINEKIEYVIAPALGGILVGYEVAKCLNSKSIFFGITESRYLVESWMRPVIAAKSIYVHAWQPGDLVIWHNRSVWHSATGELAQDDRRVMHLTAYNSSEVPVCTVN